MSTEISTTSRAFGVEIHATTHVNASAERVWSILTDTSSYPAWNPFVVRLEGEIALGNRIEVDMKPGEGTPQTLRPRIVDYRPGSSFTWLGHIGFPGVLDGRHTFTVEPVNASESRLVQHEVLSGMLVPMFRSMLLGDTPRAFVALNEALASRASA